MNKYFRAFLHRGLVFSGFGPIIMGIVYLVLSFAIEDFSLSGAEVFVAIISTYILAFVHAGASIFNQIENWPIAKSLFFHFGALYIAYFVCYIINRWIPFELLALLIFTVAFAICYFAVWLTVLLAVKSVSKKINKKLG